MPSNLQISLKKPAVLAVFSVVFLLSNFALAGKKDMSHGCHEKEKQFYGSLKKIKEKLDLTDEQKTKLKDMQATYGKEAMKKKHHDMEQVQKDLEELLKSDASDEKVREKFAALQKIQEDFAKTRFERILHIRSILTPEQRTKFKNMIGKE